MHLDKTEFNQILKLYDRAITASKAKYDADVKSREKFLKNCPHEFEKVLEYMPFSIFSFDIDEEYRAKRADYRYTEICKICGGYGKTTYHKFGKHAKDDDRAEDCPGCPGVEC